MHCFGCRDIVAFYFVTFVGNDEIGLPIPAKLRDILEQLNKEDSK